MKKLIIMSLVLGLGATSCKRKQSCPAYGKAPIKTQTEKVKA
jgi:hypothetical protein